MSITLHAYQYSVYAWIVKIVLNEKELPYEYVEINPFAQGVPDDYLKLHPFRRVPVLVHDDFTIYETTAITGYIAEMFPGRAAQIVAVIDAYGYWPMVRQVFSHRVFAPRLGRAVDEAEIQAGVKASRRTLAALEELAADDLFLTGPDLTLADLHLAPMMSYSHAAPEGRMVLRDHPKLPAWWQMIRHRESFIVTNPGVPDI